MKPPDTFYGWLTQCSTFRREMILVMKTTVTGLLNVAKSYIFVESNSNYKKTMNERLEKDISFLKKIIKREFLTTSYESRLIKRVEL